MNKCGSPMGADVDGCQNETDGYHLCPFSLGVDDEYIECDCCAECTRECEMNI